MGYCTNTEVKVYVGTVVSDADLTSMIVDVDRIVLAYFTARGIGVDTTTAKAASILLTRAEVAMRFYITGENPTSYSSGDYSQSGSADQMSLAESLKKEAFRILDEYVKLMDDSQEEQTDVTRCDAVMPQFQLDQEDVPSFFTE
jgi:hypothetical protein